MDGTFGGGDLISASLAIMLGGNGDAELHDKEVSLSTSQITGSQTAIFEYDPEDEDPQGTPPGPWDGYSLFTIDLSGVKEDIEELQQQVSDAEACRQQVIAALQEYDPDYDPDEGECPASKVEDLVVDYETVKEEAEECNQCKSAVVAAIQVILPNFNPQTCQDMVDAVEDVYEQGEEDAPEEYTFDPEVTIPDLSKIVAGDVSISAPNSDWEIEVFLYAESYDGTVTKRVRTLHTGGESWFFRPAVAFIYDGEEQAVAMPTNYRYQIGPSASEWVSITEWSITSSSSVHLSWINQDGYTRSWAGSYAGADLTPLMTGPYTVTKKS